MEKLISLSDIKELVKIGEGYQLEFKEKATSSIRESICAFSNCDGGRILVGVCDNGEIRGLKDIKENDLKISNYMASLSPRPKIRQYIVEGKVIVIDIFKQNEEIFTTSNLIYIREAQTNRSLNIEQVEELLQNRRKLNFDKKLNFDFSFKRDFNEEAFERYLDLSRIRNTKQEDSLRMLENKKFITNGIFNNCGVLLFCKDISKLLENAVINFVEYDENEEVFEIKKLKYDLIKNLYELLDILRNKLNVKFRIKSLYREEI